MPAWSVSALAAGVWCPPRPLLCCHSSQCTCWQCRGVAASAQRECISQAPCLCRTGQRCVGVTAVGWRDAAAAVACYCHVPASLQQQLLPLLRQHVAGMMQTARSMLLWVGWEPSENVTLRGLCAVSRMKLVQLPPEQVRSATTVVCRQWGQACCRMCSRHHMILVLVDFITSARCCNFHTIVFAICVSCNPFRDVTWPWCYGAACLLAVKLRCGPPGTN
jgi:hypothetical protein